jgi:hypothetical protein
MRYSTVKTFESSAEAFIYFKNIFFNKIYSENNKYIQFESFHNFVFEDGNDLTIGIRYFIYEVEGFGDPNEYYLVKMDNEKEIWFAPVYKKER